MPAGFSEAGEGGSGGFGQQDVAGLRRERDEVGRVGGREGYRLQASVDGAWLHGEVRGC